MHPNNDNANDNKKMAEVRQSGKRNRQWGGTWESDGDNWTPRFVPFQNTANNPVVSRIECISIRMGCDEDGTDICHIKIRIKTQLSTEECQNASHGPFRFPYCREPYFDMNRLENEEGTSIVIACMGFSDSQLKESVSTFLKKQGEVPEKLLKEIEAYCYLDCCSEAAAKERLSEMETTNAETASSASNSSNVDSKKSEKRRKP